MWRPYNPNPAGKAVGDCTVRAVSCALGQPWGKTYLDMCAEGYTMGDMPSSNAVWGAYLERNGYTRRLVAADCATCYTVADFCREHPRGVYVLALSGHVVCCRDGDWWDLWDSGAGVPLYYWAKEET